MFIRVLIVVVTMPLLPAICRADLIISTTNTQTLLTFDVDHAGVFTLGTGTNAGSAATGLAEATQFNARGFFNPNKLGGLHTEGVSSSHRFFTPGHTGAAPGDATVFAADSNGDGDTNDFAGSNQIGAERQADLAGFTGGNAILVSKEGDFANSGIYFRIQNNTGQTVFDWNFAADVFYEESGNTTSMFDFGYAIDNGTIPTTMSLTTIEAAATPTVGATYATLADSLNTTVSTAGVANGDYIVLGLRDLSAATNGSGIVVDNIGITASVTAVPEPSSLALLGMGLGGLMLRRRRRRKSSVLRKI